LALAGRRKELSRQHGHANDPGYRSLHNEFLLRPAGQLRQAESELMASYHLAPAYGYTLHELTVVESLLGRDTEAIRFVELNYGLYANGAPMGGEDTLPYMRRALRTGRYTEAAKWGTQALSSSLRAAGGEAVMQILCSALADPAMRPTARRALRDFVPKVLVSSDSDRVRMFFVAALTMVGDRDTAYDLMERLLDRRLNATGAGDFDWGRDLDGGNAAVPPGSSIPGTRDATEVARLLDAVRAAG
jgi:hypothetical protein